MHGLWALLSSLALAAIDSGIFSPAADTKWVAVEEHKLSYHDMGI